MEETADTDDLLPSLEIEVAEGKQLTAIVERSLEVLYAAELVEQSDHVLVGALLRYILDKHFLPHSLLRLH